MKTENTTIQIELRDNAYWPDEALLADLAEKGDRAGQTDRLLEDSTEYAVLYFVS